MVGRLGRGVNFSHERILAALSIPLSCTGFLFSWASWNKGGLPKTTMNGKLL